MIDPPHAPAVVVLLGALGAVSAVSTTGAIRAQEKPQTQPDPARLLQRARGLLEKGEEEQATRLLWQAQCALATGADKNRKLKRTIDGLAAKTDPNNSKRRAAYTAAARTLIQEANAYKRTKWFRVALHTLREAEEFDGKIVQYQLKSLSRAAPRIFRLAEKAKATAGAGNAESGPELVIYNEAAIKNSKWTVKPGLVTSSPLGSVTASPVILFEKPSHENCRLSVSIKRSSAGPGQASLVFGASSYHDYFIYELQFYAGTSATARVYHYDGQQVRVLATTPVYLPQEKRTGWLESAVRIDGSEVVLLLDGKQINAFSVNRDAHGMPGLHVSKTNENQDPVQFRNLEVEPLGTTEANPGADNPGTARLDRAEAILSKGDKDRGVLQVLLVRGTLAELEDPTRRQALAARINTLMGKAYPRYALAQKRRATAAATLCDLAETYQSSGWKTVADDILRDVEVLSSATRMKAVEASGPGRRRTPKKRTPDPR